MLYIQKGDEPDFLLDFKKSYPQKTYDSDEFSKFRIPLKEELRKEQKGLCAYCCGRITQETSHNEHIEPRHPGQYESKRSLDYYNIIASCNNLKTCGNKKGNLYNKEKFVSPLDKDCEEKFTYYMDGEIEGDTYTIELLNLNDYELKNARKAVLRSLSHLEKEDISLIYMSESSSEYPAYFNVIKWYWKTF